MSNLRLRGILATLAVEPGCRFQRDFCRFPERSSVPAGERQSPDSVANRDMLPRLLAACRNEQFPRLLDTLYAFQRTYPGDDAPAHDRASRALSAPAKALPFRFDRPSQWRPVGREQRDFAPPDWPKLRMPGHYSCQDWFPGIFQCRCHVRV